MIEYTVKVYPNGTKKWYLNGKLHREDGPAVEYPSGSKSWYLNGQRHREGGPAGEYSDGTKRWWLNGKELTEEEHRQQTQPEPTCHGKTVEIDGKTYILTLKED
jgi:hypothetical protein